MGYQSSQLREHSLLRLIRRCEGLSLLGDQGSQLYTKWRLGIFATGSLVVIGLYQNAWFHTGNALLFVFLVGFLTVSYFHQRLKFRIARLHQWHDLKSDQLARLRLDWKSFPSSTLSPPEHHPFALDLDLTGPHSLFTLLDTTFSQQGQKELIHWILGCDQAEWNTLPWADRQALVREVFPLSRLRDRCLLATRLKHSGRLDSDRITAMIQQPLSLRSLSAIVWGACTLTGLAILLFGWTILSDAPHYWLLPLLGYVFLYFMQAGHIKPLFSRALSLHMELEKLSSVIHILETTSHRHIPTTQKIFHPLFHSSSRPTQALKQLQRICHALSIKAHPLIHLGVNLIIPWDLIFIQRLDLLLSDLRESVPVWIRCIGQFDAACAFGRFAYLNPDYTWPNLETSGHTTSDSGLTASQLGHPLISSTQRVHNDFTLRGTGSVVLVTGSNMSGKSTFLRTVGINLCLAQAGGPVCASQFSWTWARLYCCIRVTDALNEGLSYFYAEVKRLKVILDAIQDNQRAPVCFLIDEIYRGTNNRERLAGSAAFVQAFENSHGWGLISTHDLELTHLASTHAFIKNAHFQESVGNGTLAFDYRLRSGPCPTTNALRIMAQEGLPVPKGSLGPPRL